MAGRSKSVAAHATVVLFFVRSLPARRKSHNNIAGTDVGIVNYLAALHATGYGGINYDCAHQITHIGSFATRRINSYSHFAPFGEQLIGSVDDCSNNFARYKHFVSPNGGRHEDVVNRPDTQQIIGIHYNCVLSYSAPYGKVSGFFPIHVGKARFGSRAIGVHYVAILGVSTQNVGHYLTKSMGKDTLVNILNSCVNVFFHCTHASHHISLA